MTHKFSRSHQNALHECPRLGWLRYYDGGRGWESRRIDVAQSTGTLLHSIIGRVLAYVKLTDAMPWDGVIEEAVHVAVTTYRTEALQRGLDIETVGGAEFELNRQAALAEGMARAWARIRLPGLHEKYKVIAVEEEWEIALDTHNFVPISSEIGCEQCGCDRDVDVHKPTGEIVCMVRIDAVLEDRLTHDLWAFEMKTTGWMDDSWLEKWRYDSQTLMHVWAVEKHLGKPCAGVIVEAFYKGAKRKNDSGEDVYYSPLIHGYLKRGVPPFDADELSWDSSNARRKGWESVDVWQWGKVKDWIAMLPDEVLANQLFSVEVFRSARELETWVAQTIEEQRLIAVDLDALKGGDPITCEQIMLRDFPARLSADCYSNKYRKRCMFLPVCYQGIEPGESELYIERTPHHVGEFEED